MALVGLSESAVFTNPLNKVKKVSEVKTPALSTLLSRCKTESDIKCATLDIDAATAEAMLASNTTNRPLSGSQVKLYSNEMLRGKWKLNGEPIIFGNDDEGNTSIISGQHRLHALIQANKIYEADPDSYPDATTVLHTVVITGVHLETADSVDQGMMRKHGHVLYRDEWIATVVPKEWNNNNSRKAKWCNTLAGAARLVWLRAGGATVSSAPKFIVSEMMEFIKEDHKGLCDFVSAVLSASEEEGAGLKISVPYIAALCYIASMDGDGKVHKATKDHVLDSVLHIAQNQVTPGTAEHALVTYWNKLFSAPGSKDRDIDIVGPFVKALNAIIADEKVTAGKLVLSKKEAESYVTHPPLLTGWDESCFIYAAEIKAQSLVDAEAAKEAKIAEREEAKATKEKEQLEKIAAKAEEKKIKDAEKAAALAEVEAAKANVAVKPGVMSALAKTTKKPLAEIPIKPVIKRKPVPAKA